MLSEKRLRSIITDTVLQEMAIDPLYPSYQEYRQAEIIAEGLFGNIVNKITDFVKSEPTDIESLLNSVAKKITKFAEKIKAFYTKFIKKNAKSSNQTNEWTERDIEWAFSGLNESNDPAKKLIQESILAAVSGVALWYAGKMALAKMADLFRKLAGWCTKSWLTEEEYDILSDDLLRDIGDIDQRPDDELDEKQLKYRRKQLKRQAAQSEFQDTSSESEFADGLTAKGDKVRTNRKLADQQHHLDHELEHTASEKRKKGTWIDKNKKWYLGDKLIYGCVIGILKFKKLVHFVEKILDTPFRLISGVFVSIMSDKVDDTDAAEEAIYKWSKGLFLTYACFHAISHLYGWFKSNVLDHGAHAVKAGHEIASKAHHSLAELIEHAVIEIEELTQLFTIENLTHTEGAFVQLIHKSAEIGEEGIVIASQFVPGMYDFVKNLAEKGHDKYNQYLEDSDADGALERMDAWSGRDQLEEAIQRILNKRALHA